ncbi:glycosyltransferase [Acinetobacter ursingii]|uniref:glycosyltransferase n=1 Tax=Acinetobacter ursingii TaxID=108980 RepID=UPI0012506AB9|nr:glycosyltransferase [Acinetobacter ursingii]
MIDIIMATYNGEKYLEAQLLSILSQTYKEWQLTIYDDSSTDETINIIEKYIKLDNRINLIRNKKNIGCAQTFLNGIADSKASFVMLCDKDEKWLDNKISELFNSIKNEIEVPCLVLSKGMAYSETVKKFIGRINLYEPKCLNEFLLNNGGLQGCSMILNRKLVDLVSSIKSEVVMHDHYLSLLAFSFGKVKYLDMDLIVYRRHEKTVTLNSYGGLLNKIQNYFKYNNYIIDKLNFEAIKSFYSNNITNFNKEISNSFKSYLYLSKVNLLKALWLIIRDNYVIRGNILFTILVFITKKRIGCNKNYNKFFWNP